MFTKKQFMNLRNDVCYVGLDDKQTVNSWGHAGTGKKQA